MDDLLIEDIDGDLVREIEERALRSGRTVDDEAIRLLELGLIELKKQRRMPLRPQPGNPQI
jgi:hypothetical protein